MKTEVIFEEKQDRGKLYVICPNHFSYLDIPTIGLIPVNAIFVGKSAMERFPLFGWMYKKLHITVDRSSLRSKYNTFKRGLEALDEGYSLIIYPEGGILSDKIPQMTKFKDGAFRVAIEKQIPLIPVTIYNNHLILPDLLFMKRMKVKMKVHRPIPTKGYKLQDINELKEKLFQVITEELTKYHENNRRVVR